MREDNAILILDACQDGILRAIGYNHKNLPKDSGIFASDSGYSFKARVFSILFVLTQLEVSAQAHDDDNLYK